MQAAMRTRGWHDEGDGFGEFGHDAGCLFVKRWRILSTFSGENGHFV